MARASSSTISNTRACPALTHPGRGSAIVTLPSAAISASAVNVVMKKAYPIPQARATSIPPIASKRGSASEELGTTKDTKTTNSRTSRSHQPCPSPFFVPFVFFVVQ